MVSSQRSLCYKKNAMKTNLLSFTCALLCSLLLVNVHAAETVVVTDNDISIGRSVEILEDPTGELTIEDILKSDSMSLATQKVPNLNISKSTFWIRFTIENQSNNEHLLLNLAYPIIDTVELYMPLIDGTIDIVRSGESVPMTDRRFKHQNFMFDLTIPKGAASTYYMKLKSGEQIMLPLSVGPTQEVLLSASTLDLVSGLYFGIVLVMLLYNLFIYFSVKDKSYLYYVVYILFVGLTQASDNGYTYKYLWPNSPQLANFMVILFPALVGSSAMLFMRNFLNTRKHIPKADKVFNVFIGLYALWIALFLLGYPQVGYQLTQITALVVSVFMLSMAYRIKRMGFGPAKFFLYAWSIFLVSVCLFVLKDLGVLPYNAITKHILHMGSAVELVLLSFALADKINILKKEKEESQEKTLEALRENDRILKEQNVVLDKKVKERTTELQKLNTDLTGALTDLKEAQSQLVDAEKMASLGLLTAGIAHEINNPINFVVSNINPLKRDIQDILEVLEKYSQIQDANDLKERLLEVDELKQDIDLDYVLTEIDMLLKGIDDGASRTAEIVKSLKTFSRLDETDLKYASVNECMEATLLLLKNSLKGQIEVDEQLTEMANIDCYPGKLNQLFMNLLRNAIHAVEHKTYGPDEKPMLWVATEETDDDVIISIKDNGTGMDDATMSRIFEPFFTTKDVGEGTGLGLSIAYNIVEKHNGVIEVISELGSGTEFCIAIPKKHLDGTTSPAENIQQLKAERKKRLRERIANNS